MRSSDRKPLVITGEAVCKGQRLRNRGTATFLQCDLRPPPPQEQFAVVLRRRGCLILQISQCWHHPYTASSTASMASLGPCKPRRSKLGKPRANMQAMSPACRRQEAVGFCPGVPLLQDCGLTLASRANFSTHVLFENAKMCVPWSDMNKGACRGVSWVGQRL